MNVELQHELLTEHFLVDESVFCVSLDLEELHNLDHHSDYDN